MLGRTHERQRAKPGWLRGMVNKIMGLWLIESTRIYHFTLVSVRVCVCVWVCLIDKLALGDLHTLFYCVRECQMSKRHQNTVADISSLAHMHTTTSMWRTSKKPSPNRSNAHLPMHHTIIPSTNDNDVRYNIKYGNSYTKWVEKKEEQISIPHEKWRRTRGDVKGYGAMEWNERTE